MLERHVVIVLLALSVTLNAGCGGAKGPNLVASLEYGLPDGSQDLDKLATTIRLWDPKNKTVVGQLSLPGFHDWAFSPDGTKVAVVARPDDGEAEQASYIISIWDVIGKEPLGVAKGHNDKVTCLAFSPDSSLLASASDDKTVRLWDASTGEQSAVLERFKENVNAVCFSPDGTTLLTGGWDSESSRSSEIILWEISTGRQRRRYEGHHGGVWALAISADKRTLAAGGPGLSVTVWDVSSGNKSEQFDGRFFRQDAGVKSISFSSNGLTLATGHVDGTVMLWDLAKRGDPKVAESSHSTVFSLEFINQDESLAVGYMDGSMSTWELETGAEEQYR